MPPWLPRHQKKDALVSAFLGIGDAVFDVLRGVNHPWLPTFSTTSPGCRPLSAASLEGSTLVITTPLTDSDRLKVLRASGVTAVRPRPIALAVAGIALGVAGSLAATFSSGRAPINTLMFLVWPWRWMVKSVLEPATALPTRRTRSRESSSGLPSIAVTTSPCSKPALAAGPLGTTLATIAPFSSLRPSEEAISGVMLWISAPR